MGSKKQYRQVGRGQQERLFADESRDITQPVRATRPGFVDPDPHEIFVGGVRLNTFLKQMGLEWIIEARQLVRGLDWSEFEEAYVGGGRAAYAPAAIVGLILYGIMEGKSSLREIEALARRDMGAMWMSGGVFPDHSVLGRFIQRHETLLTEDFFEKLTRLIITKLGSNCATLAGDGTVIESAASRFQAIRLAALQEKVAELDDASDDDHSGGTGGGSGNPAKLREALETVLPRVERSRKTKKEKASTRVNLTDPASVYLKTKRGGFSFAYVTSYLVNEDRFILACAADPSDELSVVPTMLDQAARITSGATRRILFDANYHRSSIFQAAIDRELDLLTPPPDSAHRPYGKSSFRMGDDDHLICPENQLLRRQSESVDSRTGRETVQYRIPSPHTCLQCSAFGTCTKSSRGRSVVRDTVEWAREAVQAAMQNPVARRIYNQRIATVEPVIGEMRELQNFHRFARTAESGAALEVSLHAAAYNLRRYARRAAGRGVFALFWLFWNLVAAWSRPFAASGAVSPSTLSMAPQAG